VFGLSKKERNAKLASKMVVHLRMFILPVMEEDEIPSSIKFSLYVVGCLSRISGKYHYMVKGKTDDAEVLSFALATTSEVLQVDPDKIQALFFLGFSKKEPPFMEGIEDGDKFMESFPDPPLESIEKIMKRMKGIASSHCFE